MADKKTNFVADLRKKSLEDLEKVLGESKQDYLNLCKSLKAGELANPRAVSKLRKEIAKIKTIIAEKTKESDNDKKGAK